MKFAVHAKKCAQAVTFDGNKEYLQNKSGCKKRKRKKKKKSSVLGMLQTTYIFLNISGIFFMWLQFDPFYHLIAPIFLAYNESTCTSWLLFCNPLPEVMSVVLAVL